MTRTLTRARALALAATLAALALVGSPDGRAAEAAPLLARLRAVGGEGAGNPDAAKAWKDLTALGPAALPETLAALRGASPLAANWLRGAVDAVLEAETRANRPLPREALERFLAAVGEVFDLSKWPEKAHAKACKAEGSCSIS